MACPQPTPPCLHSAVSLLAKSKTASETLKVSLAFRSDASSRSAVALLLQLCEVGRAHFPSSEVPGHRADVLFSQHLAQTLGVLRLCEHCRPRVA